MNEKITTETPSSNTISKFSGSGSISWVMNPTPNGLPVAPRTYAICSRSQSEPSPLLAPKVPKPPAADTAAASVPPLWLLIGAFITGSDSPSRSVKRVRSMAGRSVQTPRWACIASSRRVTLAVVSASQ